MPDLSEMISQAFPNSDLCTAFGQHIGPPKDTFFEEQADDRYYLIIVPRCSTCGMPCGADRDPTPKEEKQYYDSLKTSV